MNKTIETTVIDKYSKEHVTRSLDKGWWSTLKLPLMGISHRHVSGINTIIKPALEVADILSEPFPSIAKIHDLGGKFCTTVISTGRGNGNLNPVSQFPTTADVTWPLENVDADSTPFRGVNSAYDILTACTVDLNDEFRFGDRGLAFTSKDDLPYRMLTLDLIRTGQDDALIQKRMQTSNHEKPDRKLTAALAGVGNQVFLGNTGCTILYLSKMVDENEVVFVKFTALYHSFQQNKVNRPTFIEINDFREIFEEYIQVGKWGNVFQNPLLQRMANWKSVFSKVNYLRAANLIDDNTRVVFEI